MVKNSKSCGSIFLPFLGIETGKICDLVQIPAYLCGKLQYLNQLPKQKPIHLKRTIYESMEYEKLSKKLENFGCSEIILTERGTFGYNQLVNDMTFPIVRKVAISLFDATHSIQLPTSMGNVQGRRNLSFLLEQLCGINVFYGSS